MEDQRQEDQFYFTQVRDFVNALSCKHEENERLTASHEKRFKWLNDEFIANFRKEFEKKHEKVTEELMGLFGRFDAVLETNVKDKMDKNFNEKNQEIQTEFQEIRKMLKDLNTKVHEEGKSFADTTRDKFTDLEKTLELYNKEVHDQGYAFSEGVGNRLTALEGILGADPAVLDRTARNIKEIAETMGEHAMNFEGKIQKCQEANDKALKTNSEYLENQIKESHRMQEKAVKELEEQVRQVGEALVRNDAQLAEKFINIESFNMYISSEKSCQHLRNSQPCRSISQ